ncbi:MAG: hypothetical protein ACK4IT_00590 [Thioalkalivibrionaceae bacterium]
MSVAFTARGLTPAAALIVALVAAFAPANAQVTRFVNTEPNLTLTVDDECHEEQPAVAVRDGLGRCVRLAKPATRIVALTPHLAENLASANRIETLVARSERADYPPEVRNRPSVANHARIDRERLLAVRPDLVLAWQAALPPDLTQWLDRHGIPVYVSRPSRLADIEDEISHLEALAAAPNEASTPILQDADAVAKPDTGSAPVRSTTRNETPSNEMVDTPSLPPRRDVNSHERISAAVHFLWSQPLIVSANDPFLNDALNHCGLRNRFAEATSATLTLDPEQLRVDPAGVWIIGISGWSGPALNPERTLTESLKNASKSAEALLDGAAADAQGNIETDTETDQEADRLRSVHAAAKPNDASHWRRAVEDFFRTADVDLHPTIVLDADHLHRPTRRIYGAVAKLCAAAERLEAIERLERD